MDTSGRLANRSDGTLPVMFAPESRHHCIYVGQILGEVCKGNDAVTALDQLTYT